MNAILMKPALVISGKDLAAELHVTMRADAAALSALIGRPPGLGVILVGDNPASQSYVANKEKAAKACGLATFDQRLPATANFQDVHAAIEKFNQAPEVDGILLQLPLPEGLDSRSLIAAINPAKDADGLHPMNQGHLLAGTPASTPCTPLGCMALLDRACAQVAPERMRGERADLSGLHAIVIGRSVLVGKPVGILLLERNATVTMAHSKTANLPEECRRADIVIAAVGRPHLVAADWIKPGAIVIDVGINRLPDGKLTGDVDFTSVQRVAGAITPVPGGVGPLTVAMLIRNTINACRAVADSRGNAACKSFAL
jgi:methylenetetrahydrofolate dehydrogenase (NADP+)/methenyltetrahydrofolate cyclohydrolase